MTRLARRDIAAVLRWSENHFGVDARLRYLRLIEVALDAVTVPNDPLGTLRTQSETGDMRLYHLRNCRSLVRGIARPRHLIAYRRPVPDLVLIVRLLHDAMDMPAHLAG